MPFPTDGASSPVLDDLIGGPAAALTAVALVATPGARASGWAAQAAATLAAQWPGPRRIVLADLDLERPTLHDVAGIPNEEGVVDLIDYGLSLERLVHRAPGGAFDVLPAGLFAADPAAVLDSTAWERVLFDVAARRATLLAYLPADAPGAGSLVRQAGAVLVLAEDGEGDAAVARLPHPYAVLAILVPRTAEAESETPAPPAPSTAAPPASSAAAPLESPAAEPRESPAAEPREPPAPEPVAADADATPTVAGDADAVTPVASDGEGEATVVEPAPAAEGDAAEPVRPLAPEERTERLTDAEFDRIRVPRDGERATLIAELRDRQRAARLAGEPGQEATPRPEVDAAPLATPVPSGAGLVAREVQAESRPDEVGLETLTPPRRRPPGRSRPGRYRHALLWTAGVVLLTSLLAGAWHFLSGRLPRPAAVAATSDSLSRAPAEPEPSRSEDALPFVVAMEAHRDLALAVGRIDDLREIEPDLDFHIEPLEREGVLYYHVMGGPVPDSTFALALRDTLIARGHKTGRTPTDVRATPLAFLIGDYATAPDAEEQADVLRRLDIPGYILSASAADGERVFRLYVGGFAGEAEAGAVGQMLRAAGIRDTLVTRTGAVRLDVLRAPSGTLGTDSTATGSSTP